MLDFPSLLYKGLRILMFQLSGVYCIIVFYNRGGLSSWNRVQGFHKGVYEGFAIGFQKRGAL